MISAASPGSKEGPVHYRIHSRLGVLRGLDLFQEPF